MGSTIATILPRFANLADIAQQSSSHMPLKVPAGPLHLNDAHFNLTALLMCSSAGLCKSSPVAGH
jgi:hypothetical protein